MVKPPVVYTAGILRALNRTIDTTDWIWLDYQAGQQLFYPPNVAGWDDNRWLDTARFRGRWYVAATALEKTALDENDDAGDVPPDAAAIYDKALLSLGQPTVDDGAKNLIVQFGQTALADAGGDTDTQQQYAIMVYNAMRQLLLARPEAQTS
jgi:hypothetical protein